MMMTIHADNIRNNIKQQNKLNITLQTIISFLLRSNVPPYRLKYKGEGKNFLFLKNTKCKKYLMSLLSLSKQ
jgi:hypothetical protein